MLFFFFPNPIWHLKCSTISVHSGDLLVKLKMSMCPEQQGATHSGGRKPVEDPIREPNRRIRLLARAAWGGEGHHHANAGTSGVSSSVPRGPCKSVSIHSNFTGLIAPISNSLSAIYSCALTFKRCSGLCCVSNAKKMFMFFIHKTEI